MLFFTPYTIFFRRKGAITSEQTEKQYNNFTYFMFKFEKNWLGSFNIPS